MVTLSGLGSAQVFSSVTACRAGTGATTTVTIGAGQSSANFYVHADVAQPFVIGGSATGLSPGSASVNVVLIAVLGQSDTSSLSQLTTGVSTPAGVAVVGNRLFVCDTFNNRVLVWNALPTTGDQAPDFALGQPAGTGNLASNLVNAGGLSGSSLDAPQSVASDGTRLFVSDSSNNRILVWTNIHSAACQPATFALGQPSGPNNLTTNTSPSGSFS